MPPPSKFPFALPLLVKFSERTPIQYGILFSFKTPTSCKLLVRKMPINYVTILHEVLGVNCIHDARLLAGSIS